MIQKMYCSMVFFIICFAGIPMDTSVAHSLEDHAKLIKKTYTDVRELTLDCLECHEDQGKAFMKTAHWRWKGDTPFLKGHEHGVELGKINLMNDY